MSQRSLFHRLGSRVVEEAQLLAEQKWIIEALAKIRNQRNCLQIERLHLESLKAQLKGDTKNTDETKKIKEKIEDMPTTSAVNLMQSVPKNAEHNNVPGLGVTDEEIMCNEQELDLMISDCIFGSHQDNLSCMEEDEEEDDIMIDMNMLMNGDAK
ncbi:unnamed protein product [Parnassius apollo]|uniref:(apollo) hypothetical protein n=1 Tax=Parnassius apollo TaxID=110799 RepID=A0A8S3Y8K6_PARAO|nr:unnamed protein product [Parnassius apollo]